MASRSQEPIDGGPRQTAQSVASASPRVHAAARIDMDLLDFFTGVGDLLTLRYRWRFVACLLAGLAALAVLSRRTEAFAALGVLICGGLIATGAVWEWRFRREDV
jgi:hypothetical protein